MVCMVHAAEIGQKHSKTRFTKIDFSRSFGDLGVFLAIVDNGTG